VFAHLHHHRANRSGATFEFAQAEKTERAENHSSRMLMKSKLWVIASGSRPLQRWPQFETWVTEIEVVKK